ncbi:MAG: hypothetical protein E7261_11520 [Lachnospiraceae bacterium]|nr:hypothetical protein [Lachnospiraceae bacterium]
MNLELLESLQIDGTIEPEKVLEQLEEKQIEIFRRLDNVNDEERKKTLEKTLKQVEGEIESIKAEIKMLKSGLVLDNEESSSQNKQDKKAEKKAEKEAKKQEELETQKKADEEAKAKAELEAKANAVKEKAAEAKAEEEEAKRITEDLKNTLFGGNNADNTQASASAPANGAAQQSGAQTGNTGAATSATGQSSQASTAIPQSAQSNTNNEFSDALREYKNKNYNKAFPMMKKLAEAGDATAQYLVAQMYRNGYGVGRDDERWEFWMRKAADNGEVSAQFEYGKYLMANISKKASNETDGLHYLGLAAGQNDADAMKAYIDAVNAGRGSVKHVKKAVGFCTQLKTQTVDSYDKQKVDNYAETLKTTIKLAKQERRRVVLPTIFTILGAVLMVFSFAYMFCGLFPEEWEYNQVLSYLPEATENMLVPIDAYWDRCSEFINVMTMFGLQLLLPAMFFKTAGKSQTRAKVATIINAVSNVACIALLVWGASMFVDLYYMKMLFPAYLCMFFISVLGGMLAGNLVKVGLHI